MILCYLETGTSMLRTIYAAFCGGLMLIAALIPPAILVIHKIGF
jgi:hypothetical protein